MSLISAFVDTYLKLSPTEEATFEREPAELVPTEKEGVMELVTSWMERGIEQGLQQGEKRALEPERALALRVLQRKIGDVSPEAAARVRTLSRESLDALVEATLDFKTPDDLTNWLAQTK